MDPELPVSPEQGEGEGEGGEQRERGVVERQHEEDVSEGALHVQIWCSEN